MSQSHNAQAMTIGDLMGICWRRRWTALAVGVALAVITLALGSRITPMYRAEAAITVSQVQVVGQGTFGTAAVLTDYRFIATEADRLLSSPILKSALTTSGLGEQEPFASADDPVWLLRSRCDIETDRNSLTIGIGLNGESRDQATTLLAAMIDAYRASQAKDPLELDTQTVELIEGKIAQLESGMKESRTEAERIRRERGIVAADPDDNHITRRLSDISRSLLATEQQISADDAVLELVEHASQMEDGAQRIESLLEIDAIMKSPRVADTLAEYELAEDEYRALDTRLLPRHPDLAAGERLVGDTRARLIRVLDRAVESLDQDRRRLMATLATERRQLDELNAQLMEYRSALTELAVVKDRTASSEQLLQTLRMRQAELSVSSSPLLTRISITEPPHALPEPVNIKPALLAGLALFVGLIGGGIAALVHELVDPRVRTLDALQQDFGLRTIGTIPTAPYLPSGRQIADLRNHPAAVREAFRLIRSNLLLHDREEELSRVILCTSADAEDGKTTVAANLALSLAAIGRKVLLLDGDLRKPTLHSLFDAEAKVGLHEVIDERIVEDMAVEITPHLSLLTSGDRADPSEEPLHDPHLRQYYLKAAIRRYDHVIIDSTSMGEIADAYAFLDEATTILAVVRYQHTNRLVLRRMIEHLLTNVDCPVRLVLNGLPRRHLRRELIDGPRLPVRRNAPSTAAHPVIDDIAHPAASPA